MHSKRLNSLVDVFPAYIEGLKWNGYKPSDLFPTVPQTQAPRAGMKEWSPQNEELLRDTGRKDCRPLLTAGPPHSRETVCTHLPRSSGSAFQEPVFVFFYAIKKENLWRACLRHVSLSSWIWFGFYVSKKENKRMALHSGLAAELH